MEAPVAAAKREPVVMKPRSAGMTDLTVKEGDTCALPAPVVVDAVGPKIEEGRGRAMVARTEPCSHGLYYHPGCTDRGGN